jgi:hypothetical protein
MSSPMSEIGKLGAPNGFLCQSGFVWIRRGSDQQDADFGMRIISFVWLDAAGHCRRIGTHRFATHFLSLQ